ncbi:AHH domain-containing protein [Hahella ganghwensis]|uniref:AHH domain-containing protein n=1 Tax=Hahella ganghwensis TaxID=286420 RepID=UPI0003694A2D|nr:AHH domain-containing protein [Hahella ganghwensis]
MTEIGEPISTPIARLAEGKCIICDEQHDLQKKDEIKPSGWKRSAIAGVGGNFLDAKKNLYPNKESPPKVYRAEGHHCLAFSAFIMDARKSPKDRFASLNHYLKEKGYDPNNDNNCIDLPGRKTRGDRDKHAHFKEFEKAVLAGKPLQLHIGGHQKDFLGQSNLMLQDVMNSALRREFCKKPDDEFKNKLKELVIIKEDIAFKNTASATTGWIAHPIPLNDAEDYVKKKHGLTEIKYPKL